MTCNNCVKHVDKALRAVAGVENVQVSLPDQTAKVEHSEAAAVAAMIAAVESAGYDAAV
jgi:Cu2+-exporting ATPase/Cu+-exporting ATPase